MLCLFVSLGKHISVKLSFKFLFSSNLTTSQIHKIKGQSTDSMFCVPTKDSESNVKKWNDDFFIWKSLVFLPFPAVVHPRDNSIYRTPPTQSDTVEFYGSEKKDHYLSSFH